MIPRQGEIWWAETEDKRRPVLVITRDSAIRVLQRILVAPITRTDRAIPTQIKLGPDEGLREECVAAFDNVQVVLRAALTERVGVLRDGRFAICSAIAALADC